jgi:hypothetical protein
MDSLQVTEAQENFEHLQLAVRKTANSMYVVAHLLYEAKYKKYYKAYADTLYEYAAQTEIGLSASVTSKLISIYENFCIDNNNIGDTEILFKDYTKAYTSIPLLKSSKPHEVIEIIHGNSTADIITRVKELEQGTTFIADGQVVQSLEIAGTKLMQGQEWYNRFMSEIGSIYDYRIDDWSFTHLQVMEAAKKASGIE